MRDVSVRSTKISKQGCTFRQLLILKCSFSFHAFAITTKNYNNLHTDKKADSSLTPHRPSEGPREPGPSVVKHQMDTGVSLRASPDVAAEPPAYHVEDHSFKAVLL